ncbi:putative P-loop containing nucleoside triphosphate hydrolase, leucine-rich repeat domain superfamily [Helianthus annuus]|nr:putative P-loop containing nucleoside triphosphate hydrolase, leucine-rich repeat domain superfamily [Helianthus annuus]KAJ0706047.1 putative P-loop containing nucleoside triphosphate hydrolase, leucine-rich repeat domain superfamily [Helianthus annuus]KAJ0891518.1 putative P-loop containing nucleoside triphosphate hydrolase, leucine-rich repeat domain superfamily [Helianthus annuus]
MTTRQQQLLKKIGFNHLDQLESLSHEDALSLFALHALDADNFDSHTTLKPQAGGIVKKCGGLPLALKAIGRLLRAKTEGEEWNDVLNNEIWNLENADEIVPALRLSYQDLSADLKRLFAYCSLFPKDFLFDSEKLILLWIAEGYLNESTTNKSPERLGHEYFEKLLSRSFFQPAPNGESFFVMHDLMNDLATFVAGEYFFRFDNQGEMAEEALCKYRHMSFMRERYVGFHKFEAFQRARSLRTLLVVYVGVEKSWNMFYISNKILVDLLSRLPLLRVLSLRRFKISEVPDSICSLKHLRYLNLSQTKILELPENVGNLYNLQTLLVFGCEGLTTLPKSFLKLKKLRHFDLCWCTCVCTLSVFGLI